MNKKKILILVDWFAPGYKAGGPIQSCVNVAFLLKKDFDIMVLTTDTDHGETTPYPGIPPNQWTNLLDPDIRVYYAEKSTLNRRQLREQILAANADYVYLNHLYSPWFVLYPLWLKYTGRLKSNVVLCPRGALYQSAIAVKSFKKKPFIRLFRWMRINRLIRFHASNEREKEAILHYFPGSKVTIADNLPNSNQPPFSGIEKETGKLKCIFIARIVPIKNLLFLLQALNSVEANVELTIVGPVEDKAYWQECETQMAQLPSHIQVRYIGSKRNDALGPLIREHHLFVLPTAGENFGHAIFEAMLAGRPVLISDQTPWLRLPAQHAGWDLPLQAPGQFSRVIDEAAAFDQETFDVWAKGAWQYAKNFIEKPELHQKYLQLFS